jgi:gliding motility-associated-like protein
LKAANGCDSIRILTLTVLPRKTTSISESICEGQSFLGRTTSGTYRDTLKAANGCDSIRILTLTVLPRKTTSISESICEGQSFLGRTTSGTYRDTLKAANGCDSIRILTLTVLPSKTTSISESICEGQSFLGRTTSGTYRDTLKAANSCDSIRILNLTVLPRKIFSMSESICEGQSFLGRTASGTYRDTLKAANGCDSIRILNLTVLPRKTFSITQSICEGEIFLGRSATGTYRDTLQAANACDSIRVLNLTVSPIPKPNLGQDRSFCEGDSIQLSPGNFTSYNWLNGASTANIWVRNPGLYWVRVSNGACTATDTLNINALFPTPRNFLEDTFRLCLGEPIEVPGYARYLWSSGETIATYKVKQFGPLSLGVTTTEGCVGIDQTIIVSNNCKLVFIPNAFSPNGDGLNEVFRPTFGVPVTGYQAIIFNRWGQQMQLSSDPQKGWDGRWNGKDAPLGVYYYIIRFTDGGGERHERTGSVTLLR